ncbi:MAG TPA: glycine betaine ABC transporter substrate-binding protein, partial [Solirubrobacteraceae bacterium]|nr:glycine betaine ABC transporter substrate-binding protein [Solirubrobacteraceae bacterium]
PPAAPSSTHSSSAHAAGSTGTSTGTNSQTATTSTTPALPGSGKPPITVGDKNFTEQFVLGQLYAQALTAQGFTVNLNPNIGPTQVTMQALKQGSLSMYPEYLNVFNTAIAGYKRTFHTQLGAFQAAQKYAERHGLQLLPPTPFSDTYGLAVTDAYAADNHLHTIGDLRRVASQLTVGGPPQFQQGTPGLPALAAAYGVVPAGFKSMAIGDQYSALNNGVVQAADVGTTDGELATGDYQLLSDPRQIFGWGNIVPVVAGKVIAEEGPAFVDVIERVDETLTMNAMRQMNEAVDVAKLNPSDVAKQFLQTHGLLKPSAS